MQTQHSFPISYSPIVRDALVWPSGPGFIASDSCWLHTASPSERECLDNLIGLALIDQDIHDRLLVQRDPALLDAFNLSDDTRHWLVTVQADTLKELAQAVIDVSVPYRARVPSVAF
jgi:hypothetical protein